MTNEQELEMLREQLTRRFRAVSNPTQFGGTGGRATRDSVLDNFSKVQSQFEGSAANFDYMYTDKIGFVTTGMGNKIDSNSPTDKSPGMNGYGPALKLPWIHKSDGQQATPQEIIQDWQTVKAAHTKDDSYDAPHDAQITQLKLSQTALRDLIATQIVNNEEVLVKSLPNFKDFPADAQMAIHGMAWAMGSAFIPFYHFTAFQNAANAQDWATAKAQSVFKGADPARLAAHNLMFDNALTVTQRKVDPEPLYYPGTAPTTGSGLVSTASEHTGKIVAGVLLIGAVGTAGYVYRDELGRFAKKHAPGTVAFVKKIEAKAEAQVAKVRETGQRLLARKV